MKKRSVEIYKGENGLFVWFREDKEVIKALLWVFVSDEDIEKWIKEGIVPHPFLKKHS